MGWGDEIIVTGQARLLQSNPREKIVVQDRHGQHREHEMWRGNPRIATRSERLGDVKYLKNGPGHRPYIAEKHTSHWKWKEWECPVGEIYLTEQEQAFAAKFDPGIIIEPAIKQKASPNKDWGRARWERLVELLRPLGLPISQIGSDGTQVVAGAKLIQTPSFRAGCAVLARARVAVLPEGGLHHAAAALGVKAVVIFGGYISPKQTGYAMHTNLFTGGEPCGMRILCPHCARAMNDITPNAVAKEVGRLLNG